MRAATLRFGRWLGRPLKCLRDRRRLLRSALFDAAYYRRTHGLASHADAAAHFLREGAAAGLSAHPLFDTAWYLAENPDVAQGGANPVLHYLGAGAAEGRDPNAFFSSAWYLRAYPAVAAAGVNPLAHYVRHGAREGRRPSLRFDPVFYLRQLPNGAAPEDPLAHFLLEGRRSGLRGAAEALPTAGVPVEWARISALLPWSAGVTQEVALFVAHAPGGRVKPHVRRRLDALRADGMAIVLVVASDDPLEAHVDLGPLAGLYVRENSGFDFAAWAHLLALEPRLWDAASLLLTNDSLIGPCDEADHSRIVERARASMADVVALTESRERAWHLQSYFLWLKPAALLNARLQGFFRGVRALSDKQAVINSYELAFAATAIDAGLTTETLFRPGASVNATVFAWRELLDERFPFVKSSVIVERHADVGLDVAGWRDTLRARGFDMTATQALVDAEADPRAAGSGAGPAQAASPWRAERIAFHGPWNYANGLGAASRGYLSALWRLDARLNLHALKLPFHIHRRLSPGWDVQDFVQPPDAAIIHLNPDGWHLLTPEARRAIDRARLRIGVWVWEMDATPDFFRPNLDKVDAVWTPSSYCADVFAAAVDAPVHVVPHVVAVPPPVARRETRTILYAFDGASYLARKNPGALVRAFARSGLAGRGWRLLLKTKHLMDDPQAASALLAAAAAAGGVEVIDRPVEADEMRELFVTAAIYASSHASEGFGLTIAEAMAAGKRVVATDYGGSRDFLDASCGWPVAFDEVELDRDHGHYRRGGRWAQVREDALAEALTQASASWDAQDAARGDRARTRIAERLSADAVARAMRESFAQLEAAWSPQGGSA